ncbi:MAG: aminopeptidase P N-terminal domain-containing protein, partial [Chitinophagales bacterium]
MKYLPIDPQLFIDNRNRLVSHLLPNSIAFFHANDEMPKSADMNFEFRQNADLFHLTGIDQEETVLLIFPDCPLPEYKEVLLLRRTNEVIAVWEGHKYTVDEARKQSGIKTIMWLDEFESILHMLMTYAHNVYLDTNENYRAQPKVEDQNLRFAHQLMRRYPVHDYHRSAPIMMQLRQIKSAIEVSLIKEAI